MDLARTPKHPPLAELRGRLNSPPQCPDSFGVPRSKLTRKILAEKRRYTFPQELKSIFSVLQKTMIKIQSIWNGVDLGGIEPPPRQCECRVMPFYYRPFFL